LGVITKVPVDLNVTLTLIPTYSRSSVAKFSLNDFANGSLLTTGTGPKKGGWI
jgi:hypothetical protein